MAENLDQLIKKMEGMEFELQLDETTGNNRDTHSHSQIVAKV